MKWADLLSYFFALIAATGNAVANVMQRRASLAQGTEEPFSLRMLARLVRTPTWILGFGGMVASFVFQAVALGLGQLSAVEPIITLEVPLTLLVASRVFQAHISANGMAGHPRHDRRHDRAGGGARPAPRQRDARQRPRLRGGRRSHDRHGRPARRHRPDPPPRLEDAALLGAAAGTTFGLTATFIKETAAQLTDNGLVAMLETWQTYAAIAAGSVGS